jgi:uncharacterized membrane protein YkoI
MEAEMRKRIIATLAATSAAAVVTLGVIGTAARAESPSPSPSTSPKTSPRTSPSTNPATSPAASPATPKSGESEKQEPSFTGSIAAPQGADTEDEAAEAAALAKLAKLSEADARSAALAKFPGATIQKASLGDENGYVVWEVQLTDSTNAAQEVKVDAGNGTILATEAGGADNEKSGSKD